MSSRTDIPTSIKTSVLVADATPMDCQLVSEAIQRHTQFRVIDRVVNSSDAISAVRRFQPDVAVISARLQDGAFAGLLALRGLRAFPNRSRIVMVLDNDERELVIEAFLNNARGIFCRLGSSGELRKCIQSVHNGEVWVNNTQIEYIVEALMQAPARAIAEAASVAGSSSAGERVPSQPQSMAPSRYRPAGRNGVRAGGAGGSPQGPRTMALRGISTVRLKCGASSGRQPSITWRR